MAQVVDADADIIQYYLASNLNSLKCDIFNSQPSNCQLIENPAAFC